MKSLLKAALFSSSLLLVACATDAQDSRDGATAGERGLGKADGVFGSCFDGAEKSCGGPAAEGNCWCDDLCASYGDCCADKAEACGGEEPPPSPQLCMGDNDCGAGQVCDHTECLSACNGTADVCPAVCMGECVDGDPEPPACGAPEEFVDVTGEELFANPDAFVGQKIALKGTARLGFPICTQLACFPEAPCCNSCGAGIELDTGAGTLEVSGIGCGGNNCDVMQNCDYEMGEEFIAWGTLDEVFGFFHLEVEDHCAVEPEPEPEPACDCDEGELCIPLCPVCAAGSPPEACQCTSTCIAGPDEPPCFVTCMGSCDDAGNGACEELCTEQCEVPTPQFCSDDTDCAEDEVCDPSLCVPSCPFCLDCNAACVPKDID